MKSLKMIFLILTTLTVCACTDSKLPKYVELTDLRVLTLVSDKPEVNPSEVITVTPLISDVNETTSLSFEAFGCIDPGVSVGAEPSCANNPTVLPLSQGTITSATNSDMAQNFTGLAPTFNAVIPAEAIIFSQRSELEKMNGLSYLIEYKISNSRGQTVSSVKRILVSNKIAGQKNENPIISQVLSNGVALGNTDFPLAGKYTLQTIFNPSSFQSYTLQKDDGSTDSRFEELTTTWFITEGSLKYFRSLNEEVNEFTAPESLTSARKSFLISVSRDSRGGATYKRVCGGC